MSREFIRQQDNIGKFRPAWSLTDGRVVGLNKRRLYETPFFLLTDPPNNDVLVPAALTSAASGMRVSGEGPAQLTQMGAVRDSSHNVCLVWPWMRDGSGSIKVSNVPLHIDTIFGPGGQMYPLPEGLYIDETRSMVVTFQSLSTDTATNARVCVVGAKYSQLQADPSLARVKERLKASQFLSTPQFYGVNDGSVVLTLYQTKQYTIEINGDSNFELHQLSVSSTGPFLLNIEDMATNKSLINAPRENNYAIPSTLILGDGSFPYRFHEPILVFAGQKLLLTFIDTSGSANTIYLTLGGVSLKVRDWS